MTKVPICMHQPVSGFQRELKLVEVEVLARITS